MDSFFLSYCSVCDKSLDGSSSGLYCSEECRHLDACDKNMCKLPSKPLNYPSVLKCPYKHCHESAEHTHTEPFSSPIFHTISNPMTSVVAVSLPRSIPDLSHSDDDDSSVEDWEIPALSLNNREIRA